MVQKVPQAVVGKRRARVDAERFGVVGFCLRKVLRCFGRFGRFS